MLPTIHCAQCGNPLIEEDGKIVPCEACISEAYTRGLQEGRTGVPCPN